MPWAGRSAADGITAPIATVLTSDVLSGLAEGRTVASSVGATIPGITPAKLPAFAMDCLYAVVEERLDAELLPTAIKAAGYQDAAACSKALCDIIWIVWSDLEGSSRHGFLEDAKQEKAIAPLGEPHAKRVVEAVQSCRKAGLVKDRDLLESLDVRLICQLNMTALPPVRGNFPQQLTTVRTNRGQKVSIFNGYREESEGFAKLMTLLNNSALSKADLAALDHEVNRLSGFFRLNPFKIVYSVISAIEANLASAEMLLRLEVMQERSWLEQCIAMRLLHRPAEAPPPSKLMDVLAILLKEHKVSLEHVLCCMSADVDSIGALFAGDKFVAARTRAREFDSKETVHTAMNFDLNIGIVDKALTQEIGSPLLIQLLQAMLRSGAWSDASVMLHYLADKVHCRIAVHRDIALALLGRLKALLGPAHAVLYPHGKFRACLLAPGCAVPDDLPVAEPLSDEVMEVVLALNTFAYRRPDVLTILWRVLTHILFTHKPGTGAFSRAYAAVCDCAFPSACMLPSNFFIWDVVGNACSALSQVHRCQVYYACASVYSLEPRDKVEAKKPVSSSCDVSLLKARGDSVIQAVQMMVKKTSIPRDPVKKKQAIQAVSVMLGKLVCSHPVAAALRILEACRMFDNSVELFLQCTASLPLLLREIIMFEGIRYLLCTKANRIGADGMNSQEWHNNLSNLLAGLVATYTDLDPYIVFLYSAQTMRLQQHELDMDVKVLDALLAKNMSPQMHQLNAEQMQSLFCGPVIRSHKLMLPFFTEAERRDRAVRLFKSMHDAAQPERSLVMPLYILLCQQHTLLSKDLAGDSHQSAVNLAFGLTECTHHVITKYINCLHNLPTASFQSVIPSLADLWGKYELQPEYVMTLYRPFLREAIKSWDVGAAELQVPLLKNGHDNPASSASGAGGRFSLAELVQDVCSVVPHFSEVDGKTDGQFYVSGPFDARFYILFWALELSDICEDTTQRYDRYRQELLGRKSAAAKQYVDLTEKKRKQERDERSQQTYAGHNSWGPSGFEPKMDSVLITEADIEEAKLESALIEQKLKELDPEQKAYEQRAAHWLKYLTDRKDQLFKVATESRVKTVQSTFLQICVVPRCMFSKQDALFCAYILGKLASLNAPGYRHTYLMDAIFQAMVSLMRSCTDHEASNLAIFLKECLTMHAKTVNDEWLSAHPQSMKEGETISFGDYRRITTKFKKRAVNALCLPLEDPHAAGPVVVRNALKMIGVLYEVLSAHSPGNLKQLIDAVKGIGSMLAERKDIQTLTDVLLPNLEKAFEKHDKGNERAPAGRARPVRRAGDDGAEEGEVHDDNHVSDAAPLVHGNGPPPKRARH